MEALRTLKLLEQHHQRLSEILQIDLKKPTRGASAGAEDAEHQDDEKSTSQQAGSSSHSTAAADDNLSEKTTQQPMPTLHRPPRYPSRDLGASIASNLASARGIRSKYRSQPLSPSMTSTEAPGSVENAQGNKGESRSRIQNMLEHADKPGPQSPQRKQLTRQASSGSDTSIPPASPVRSRPPPQDEGFSKFYSAFGTIMNRISAPLAFAGLPLISEDQTAEPAPVAPAPEIAATNPRRTRLKPSPSVLAEPDISKIYSKATLRAISRDGQLASDSFYVVPTSGHTTTYANILKFEDKEKRRMEASLHSNISEHMDDDDFVDARESQAPDSPGGFVRRRAATAGPVSSSARLSRAEKESLGTIVEELRLENKSLKDMLDKLSKRLHAFESMSQNSGMRLAESMRLMRPGSPGSITSGAGGGKGSGSTKAKAATTTSSGNAEAEVQLRRKNRELEDQLAQAASRMEQLEKDYSQARANLGRYRERWEQLKAGAKARRAGGGGGGASSIGSAGAGGGTGGGGSLGGLGSGDGRFDEEGRGGSMSPSLALSRDR